MQDAPDTLWDRDIRNTASVHGWQASCGSTRGRVLSRGGEPWGCGPTTAGRGDALGLVRDLRSCLARSWRGGSGWGDALLAPLRVARCPTQAHAWEPHGALAGRVVDREPRPEAVRVHTARGTQISQ